MVRWMREAHSSTGTSVCQLSSPVRRIEPTYSLYRLDPCTTTAIWVGRDKRRPYITRAAGTTAPHALAGRWIRIDAKRAALKPAANEQLSAVASRTWTCSFSSPPTLLALGCTYGDPNAGDPIQYDELRIEHDQGDVEIVVYNRAPTLKIEPNLFGGFDLRHTDGKVVRCEKKASGETECRVVQEGQGK